MIRLKLKKMDSHPIEMGLPYLKMELNTGRAIIKVV